MPALTKITRGTTVKFSTSFFDESGNPVNPASAAVTVSFPVIGDTYTTANVTLTQGGNVWTGSWDTKSIAPGKVYWRVFADMSLDVADQGEFDLVANPANTAL